MIEKSSFPAKAIFRRLFPAWLLSLPLAVMGTGILANFYPAPFELALSSSAFNTAAVLAIFFVLPRVQEGIRAKPFESAIALLLLAVITVFGWILFGTAKQFPGLFDARFYLLEGAEWISFGAGILFSFPAAAWIARTFKRNAISQPHLGRFVEQNLAGLIVSFFFFGVYFFLASIFNQPIFNADDIFFDADTRLWRWRFATEQTRDYYWRGVHPFVLIIIRPLVALIAIPLKGNTLYAAFILTAIAGALCVFIVWYLTKRMTGNGLYAMLIAALLGASAAHLAFGSLIETYIFLAAAALAFILLLFTDKPLSILVAAGLIAFGITISNFAQTVIAHFVIKRNIRQLILYGSVVAALVVPLTLLNNAVYPNSQPYFFDLSTYEGEGHNQFEPTWERANLLARVMILHSFIAPEPLIRDEDDVPYLKVWMFRAAIRRDPMMIARYESTLGRSLVMVWLALLALGAALFLKNLRRQDHRLPLTSILILLFNFALHMRYGKEVFLYSANWTYAIVLLLAIAWRDLAEKRWFQISLLVFIALMLLNNSQLFHTMLSTSAIRIK